VAEKREPNRIGTKPDAVRLYDDKVTCALSVRRPAKL
jgi:hypothetical protein